MLCVVTARHEELVESTRKEEGCIKYELYQDEKDSRTLVIVEEWESKESLDKHWSSDHFARIVPMIGDLTEKGATVETVTKESEIEGTGISSFEKIIVNSLTI